MLELVILVYVTELCVCTPVANRSCGAGGNSQVKSSVRARHEEQRPRPQHHRCQGDPRARAILQGEGLRVCVYVGGAKMDPGA